MTLDDALFDVCIAFRQVEFSIKLLSFCERNKIDPAEFDTHEIVRLKHGNLSFPPGNFKEMEAIVRAASVAVSLAFGASALILDKAWEVAGIDPDPLCKDGKVKLRTLVYLVRCAYAHGLAEPKWKVHDQYRQVLEVDLLSPPLRLDLCELDGQGFDPNQLGGHAIWFKVRDKSVCALNPLDG